VLNGRRLHKGVSQDGVGSPNCHQAGNPGLEAKSGQKGVGRIVQQGHGRITRRHGSASSSGARPAEGVPGEDQVAGLINTFSET